VCACQALQRMELAAMTTDVPKLALILFALAMRGMDDISTETVTASTTYEMPPTGRAE
jgi:hypothetical protein